MCTINITVIQGRSYEKQKFVIHKVSQYQIYSLHTISVLGKYYASTGTISLISMMSLPFWQYYIMCMELGEVDPYMKVQKLLYIH